MTEQPSRKILGVSLSVALARDVKEEAARRGISLKRLFEEMWELYRQTHKKGTQ
jgi:hypothetical protein